MARNEKLWRCACGDDHFLSVIYYDTDPEGWVSVIDGTHCPSLWCKIKAAWQLIRKGNSPHFGCEVVLTPENAAEIAQAVSDAAKRIGNPV